MNPSEKQLEYQKDVEARRTRFKMMNYFYLSYKSISLLNHTYSRDILESLGLQISVPRTFMTIESIMPKLNKPIDIRVKWNNKKEKEQAERVAKILKAEWNRSGANSDKKKAEKDALLYGTGYLLAYFDKDEEETDIFDGYEKDGKIKYKKGKQVNYEGMRCEWLDPYYVIPDRKAKTYEHGKNTSPRRIWVSSIWDYDEFKKYAKEKGFKNLDKLEKGGMIEEFDSVRKTIDALFTQTITDLKTRDNGLLVGKPTQEKSEIVDDNSILVVTEYTPKEKNIYAGANFTPIHEGKNEYPKKVIPIFALKDYDIPGELEGVGEAEVMRWQQYEENKIHNLMYLQVILNTVKRYGIIEEMLVDPTDAKMTNPLKPIRLKYFPNAKVNDAIQVLNQASANDVPLNVLREIKTIGQMSSGQTDYAIGASQSQADTLGEAEIMQGAGNERIREKIKEMEEEGIRPLLEFWLAAIPQFYTEELDFRLNDGTNKDIKFLPYSRKVNKNAKLIAEYAIREGQPRASTIEGVFLNSGYDDVVFVDDLIGKYDIMIKTSLASLDRIETIKQYQQAIAIAMADNQANQMAGQMPQWNVSKLNEELLAQFDTIIEDVNEYKLEQPAMSPINTIGQLPPIAPDQPEEMPMMSQQI